MAHFLFAINTIDNFIFNISYFLLFVVGEKIYELCLIKKLTYKLLYFIDV